MPSIEFDDDRPPRSRDELLASVRRDGLRRRHRRRGLIGGVALVLVGALAIPVIADGDGGPKRKVVAIDQPTTTAVEETTTTTVATDIDDSTTTSVAVAPPPSTPPTTTKPRRATTTTTALVCRNSFDPRCGPFRWDPDPGANSPGSVAITFTPSAPRVGEQVTAHITLSDPDGPAPSCSGEEAWGDGTRQFAACSAIRCDQDPHGPWTPPARRSDTVEFSVTHTYDAPGTYTVTYTGTGVPRGACDGPTNPYSGDKSGSATVTVSPAPA